MYKKTSPQLTLTEPAFQMSGILPKNDWSFIYKDKIWPLIDENQFKHLYSKEAALVPFDFKRISMMFRNKKTFV